MDSGSGERDSQTPLDSASPLDAADSAHAPPMDAGEAGPTAYWTFADSFDDGNLSRWSATSLVASNGTLSVVDSGAYDECCALQATAMAGAGQVFENVAETWTTASPSAPAVTAGTIAVRSRFNAMSLDENTGILGISQGGTSAGPTTGIGGLSLLSTDGTHGTFQVWLQTPANQPGTYKSSSTVVPSGWRCAELVMNVDAIGGTMSLFLDGASPAQVSFHASTTAAAGWDSALVGVSTMGATPASVLFDDVVIALYDDSSPTIHIGCGP